MNEGRMRVPKTWGTSATAKIVCMQGRNPKESGACKVKWLKRNSDQSVKKTMGLIKKPTNQEVWKWRETWDDK